MPSKHRLAIFLMAPVISCASAAPGTGSTVMTPTAFLSCPTTPARCRTVYGRRSASSQVTRMAGHLSDFISEVKPMITPLQNDVPDGSYFAYDSNIILTHLDPSPATTTGELSPETDIAVFVIGLIPFVWATIEFWRRIAVGESFGTGADSVVIIGEDDAPTSSRGRRVLGKGALAAAYVLFTIAALAVGIAVYSVVSSPSAPPPLGTP